MIMKEIILLMSLFCCHFLGDFTHISTSWILNAKRLGKPLTPIFVHACIHGLLMFIPLLIYNGNVWCTYGLIYFQILTHFSIDLLKGRMNGWFPTLQNPANKWHWIVFGFDQLLHTLVIIIMFAILVL